MNIIDKAGRSAKPTIYSVLKAGRQVEVGEFEHYVHSV